VFRGALETVNLVVIIWRPAAGDAVRSERKSVRSISLISRRPR
jgi:hypothetical protein